MFVGRQQSLSAWGMGGSGVSRFFTTVPWASLPINKVGYAGRAAGVHLPSQSCKCGAYVERSRSSQDLQPQPLSCHCHCPSPVSIEGAIAGVLSMSALLQCRGRTDRNLLCSKHSPGTGESRGNSGCLPDCQEPAAAEATHGPDTGMLPAYLSMPPQLLQPFSVRASSGDALPRDPWLSEACVTTDLSLPVCSRQNKP